MTAMNARLSDPRPLDPHHAEIADGAHVVLRWEPVSAAERYRVQIAPDSDFREIVFEQDLSAEMTALVVQQHFPGDDRTFFWRVLAGDGEGWSGGDRIESFTSGTTEQVGRFVDPDASEPFGPVAGLFSAASLEVAAQVLPGRQPAIERALGEVHPEGTEAVEVMTAGLTMMIAVAIVAAVLVFLFFVGC